jgi:hypothetical protein
MVLIMAKREGDAERMLLLCKVNLKSQKNCSHHHRGKPSGLL